MATTKKVSVIHSRSNEVAEADSYTVQSNGVTVVKFYDEDVDLPLKRYDWYWVVIGGESDHYELQKVGRSPRLPLTRLDFKN
jgi:hypothetical protein